MNYWDFCYKIYWKLQSVIAPSLTYSQTIYESVLRECIHRDHKWLDLGCGHQLLPPWRLEQEKGITQSTKEIVGLDYDFESLKKHRTIHKRVRGDITRLPFKDSAFDIVTSNMVFEHLDDPDAQLREIRRILKPGGTLLFHTPNALSYATLAAKLIPESVKDRLVYLLQKRKEEDVFPAYYKINSPRSIREHARASGFEVDEVRMITSSAQLVVIPPLVFFELVLIRMLMTDRMKPYRTNIIVRLTKPRS